VKYSKVCPKWSTNEGFSQENLKTRWYREQPRPAMHVPGGVLELMPICDNQLYYTFKFVNCHPNNPQIGKQTVVATGQLSEINTGYKDLNIGCLCGIFLIK